MNRGSIKRGAFCLAVLVAMLPGCASPTGGPAFTLAQIDGPWRLEVLDGVDVTGQGIELRIDADAQRIRGRDGCGALDGELSVLQHRLKVLRMNPTVACAGRAQEIRDALRLVLGVGGRLQRLTREGRDWLALEGGGHEILLAARR